MNWLRAAVLGAGDGIVSVAGLVVGVAGATNSRGLILTAGLAGLVAGALSMAAGEYVSVSSQRDTQRTMLDQERRELRDNPHGELAELKALYVQRGLSEKTAAYVARELTAHDPLAAHASIELGINPDDLTDPWQAALASAGSFTLGAAIPLVAILLPSGAARVPVTFVAVLVALVITGSLSARVSGASPRRAIMRVVIGGAIAMAITYGVGRLFHVSGA
jgi:VIT1/CCC1 family predicted Fe2+/Mn2+ transporter